jgi:hypothetical protein
VLNPDYRDMLSAFADAVSKDLGRSEEPRSLLPVAFKAMYMMYISHGYDPEAALHH